MAGAWPGPGTIEVEWTVRAHLPVRLPWLAPEELARMQRQPPALGRAWAAARCWVRARLAHRLDADPAALRLREGPSRRPTLAGTLQPAPGADFNVSHTDAVVVLAVSGGPVGVDVDVAPADPDLLALAEVVASPAELAQLRSLPADQLQDTFIRWWVRKEAVLKAQGTGFLRDPRAIHVGTGDIADPPPPWVVTDLGRLPAPGHPLLAVAHGGPASGVDPEPSERWAGPVTGESARFVVTPRIRVSALDPDAPDV